MRKSQSGGCLQGAEKPPEAGESAENPNRRLKTLPAQNAIACWQICRQDQVHAHREGPSRVLESCNELLSSWPSVSGILAERLIRNCASSRIKPRGERYIWDPMRAALVNSLFNTLQKFFCCVSGQSRLGVKRKPTVGSLIAAQLKEDQRPQSREPIRGVLRLD